jgi:hypothetical protein
MAGDLERVGIETLELGASLFELGIEPAGRRFVVRALIAGVAFGRFGHPLGSPEGLPGHRDRV